MMAEDDLVVSSGFVSDVKNFLVDQTNLIGPNILGCAAFGFIAILSSKICMAWMSEVKSEEDNTHSPNQILLSSMLQGANYATEKTETGKSLKKEAAFREELKDVKFEFQRSQAKITILKADLDNFEQNNQHLSNQLDERREELRQILAEKQYVDKKLTEAAKLSGVKNAKKEAANAAMDTYLHQIETSLQEGANYQEQIILQMEKAALDLAGSLTCIKTEQVSVETELTQIKSMINARDLQSFYLKEHPSDDGVHVVTAEQSNIEIDDPLGLAQGPVQSNSSKF